MADATIGGRPLSYYSAKMLSYTVGASAFSGNFFLPPNSLTPISLTPKFGSRLITIVLDFDSSAENNIAKMTIDTTAVFDLVLPDGNLYTCALQSVSAPRHMTDWIQQTTFVFEGVRRGTDVTRTLSATGSVSVTGDLTAPVRLTVTTSLTTVTVMGIQIRNANTGITIIDGIETMTIKRGSQNVLNDVSITAFPRLPPGTNTITITPTPTQVSLVFRPLYR